MLQIFHNPRCAKSRETLKILEDSNEFIEVVEYLKTTPSAEELEEIVEKLGIKPEELLRKGEAIYKEKFKGKSLTDDQWLEAMVEYPKLIERPIVIKGNKAIIGRPPEKVLEFL